MSLGRPHRDGSYMIQGDVTPTKRNLVSSVRSSDPHGFNRPRSTETMVHPPHGRCPEGSWPLRLGRHTYSPRMVVTPTPVKAGGLTTCGEGGVRSDTCRGTHLSMKSRSGDAFMHLGHGRRSCATSSDISFRYHGEHLWLLRGLGIGASPGTPRMDQYWCREPGLKADARNVCQLTRHHEVHWRSGELTVCISVPRKLPVRIVLDPHATWRLSREAGERHRAHLPQQVLLDSIQS